MRFGIQLQFLLLIGIFKESYTRKIDDVQSIHPPIDMERGPAQDTISRSISAQPNDQIEINNEKNSLEDLEFTDRTAQSTNFKHPSDFPNTCLVGEYSCKFPWTFNGITYDGCGKGNDDFYWCPTQLDVDGNFIPETGRLKDNDWKPCPKKCKMDCSNIPTPSNSNEKLECEVFKKDDPEFKVYKVAQKGYDFFDGNIWNVDNSDPGQKIFDIFEFGCTGDNRKEGIYDFVSTSGSILSCYKSVVTKSYKTLKDYLKDIYKSQDFSAGAEVSTQFGVGVEVWASAKYDHESSQLSNQVKKLYQENRGEIQLGFAKCERLAVAVDIDKRIRLNDGFIEQLVAIHNAFCEHGLEEAEKEMIHLIRKYGTHFASETYIGAAFRYEQRFVSKSTTTEEQILREKCSSNAASICAGVGAKVASGEVCGSFSRAGCDKIKTDSSHTTESSINSFYQKPIGVVSMENWDAQDLEKNVPVRRKLRVISDLFTTKNLGESTIYGIPKTLHHTALKTVYEKVMNDYCQKIKGFDCSVQRKGCSINGACDELKETCFDDPREPDGYRCEDPNDPNTIDTATCNGTPRENCCTPYRQCKNGEGGCEADIECEGSLTCGEKGSCGDADKSGNLRCCQTNNLATTKYDCSYDNPKNVNYKSTNGWNCCTNENKCDQFQGDCDNNEHCKAGLVCGSNNCPTGMGIDLRMDCCWKEDYNSGCGARDKLLNKRTGTNTATGPLSNYCCTPNNPCRKEEGECRTDDSCMGGLVCGSDNCPQPFKTCCQKRKPYNKALENKKPCLGGDSCCSIVYQPGWGLAPCLLGEGDCDNNWECGSHAGSNFKCKEGCEDLPIYGIDGNWDSTDSCCYYEGQ